MNVIQYLMEKRAGYVSGTSGKFDPEAISKLASYGIAVQLDAMEEDAIVEKTASEEFEKLSEEEAREVENYVNYGRGVAYGEYIGKQAGYIEGSNAALNILIEKTAELFGPEAAEDLYYTILKEAGVEDEDLQNEEDAEDLEGEIRDEAAAQLIEEAGGLDNISDEDAEQLAQVAETAGRIGAQEVMEGGGGDDGDDEE